jgi:hypothetical protein
MWNKYHEIIFHSKDTYILGATVHGWVAWDSWSPALGGKNGPFFVDLALRFSFMNVSPNVKRELAFFYLVYVT